MLRPEDIPIGTLIFLRPEDDEVLLVVKNIGCDGQPWRPITRPG